MANEKIVIEMLQKQGETLNDLQKDVSDLKVLVVGDYVTRDEFSDYKKEQTNSLRWGMGFVFVVGGLLWSIVSYFIPSR